MRNSKHTILIVCEGDNTEPFFFNSIRDLLKSGEFEIGDIEITLRPEPRIEDNDESTIASSHKPKRKQQQLRKVNAIQEPEIITGIPPLKWVLDAQKDLEDGTFNEAWTVFDHDNHPARKEAFEKAQKEINGKKVNIAFSSISFEYYLLLHFERIYYPFRKSECREGKEPLNCNSGQHELDCYGEKCVGGYLRNKGYFSGSTKGRKSVFPYIKDKLEIAFENAAWLRFQSEQNEQDNPEYDRNPYITTDEIVKRLIGIETSWHWISINTEYHFGNFSIFINDQKTISIDNNGKITILITEGSVVEVERQTGTRNSIGDQIFVNAGESKVIADLNEIKPDSWFIFTFESYHIMFEF